MNTTIVCCKASLLICLLHLLPAVSFSQNKPGYKNLFDGSTLKGWKILGGKATYTVSDGVIIGTTVANTPNTFLTTEEEYGDFILELDIKVEDSVNNSGIQIRSHFDPAANGGQGKVYGKQFEIDPSSRGWAGGIYDEGRRGWLYTLDLNASARNAFRLNEFNQVKIECRGDETKTWINGKPAAYVVDTIDRKGFICLQVHSVNKPEDAGKKIHFKNVRIKTGKFKPEPFPGGVYVVNLKNNALSEYEKGDGWKLLFDGRDVSNWRSARTTAFPEKGWKVDNGMLTVVPSGGQESTHGGDIITKEKYASFDLSFAFRLTPGANSGVKYFVTLQEKTDGSAIGLEYQLLDDTLHPDAKMGIEGNRTLASLYDLIKADKQKRFLNPIGAWNTGRIVAYPDRKVEHYLNGIKVVEFTRGSAHYRELVAGSKYKGWENFGEADAGHILLQDHGNEVSFKNIKIKRKQ